MSQNPAVRQPIPVGKYFLDRGKISEQQLDLALKHRAEFDLKLGQSLVEMGFVTEAEMVEALRYQARFPCIHLTGGIVSPHVAHKLGEEVSRRLRALGLSQFAGHTTVALEDPSDVDALEELAHILATRIFPVYAEPSAIKKGIELVFGAKAVRAPAPAARREEPATAAARKPAAPAQATPAQVAPADVGPEPDERAVIERVRTILHDAFAQGVSDIHMEARQDGMSIRFRVDGALREHSRLPAAWVRQTVAGLEKLAKLDGEGPPMQVGRIPFPHKNEQFELGVALTPSLHGKSLVLHVERSQRVRRDLRDLGLDGSQYAQLEEALSARGGLVVVSGPSGSGRTGTLHALLAHLVDPDKKAIALEPRVEFEHEGVLHVEHGAARPTDAARMLLRQDPDLLLVGEIDGGETAGVLLDAARSGKSVLSSLRASGALETVVSLVGHGLESYLLADSLRCVVAQRLVRRVCTDCKAPIVPDEVLRARLGSSKDGATYFEGEGCDACHHSGYRGRLPLFEVLTITPGLRHQLEQGADGAALARAARADGFTTLREHGLRQARHGLTTLHEVLAQTERA